jgi:hypothetical protein
MVGVSQRAVIRQQLDASPVVCSTMPRSGCLAKAGAFYQLQLN